MKLLGELYVCFTMLALGHSFILFPEELMSLLNIFYSRIPPVRFGVDNTKVGLGFRVGRNVRVETIFELGPQNASTPFPPLSSAKGEVLPRKGENVLSNRQAPRKKSKAKKSGKLTAKLQKAREQSTTTKARERWTTPKTTPPPTTEPVQNATELDMRENEIDHTDKR